MTCMRRFPALRAKIEAERERRLFVIVCFGVDEQLPAIRDHNRCRGLAQRARDLVDAVQHVEGFFAHAHPEYDVVVVEPRCFDKRDVKLGAVCVGSAVRHRQATRPRVPQNEVLILEQRLALENGFRACAILMDPVAGLTDQITLAPMERRALEGALLPLL